MYPWAVSIPGRAVDLYSRYPPAESDFLVQQEPTLIEPRQASLEPLATAQHRRDAGGAGHIAGGAALPQVGQQQCGPRALAHREQGCRWVSEANRLRQAGGEGERDPGHKGRAGTCGRTRREGG
ncbi:hypothetical protein A6R68_04084 [Neotoma lepida]|uniref:Uncharacterized protein n=1 Tax=Neotoma lepida TaxID=56216 RepID=A0A1A6GPU8_NEOLE|nr:hypothetical protein A6R68_04084 [Neotoma lepida]